MDNTQTTLIERLRALFNSLMEDPKLTIPAAFRPVASNLVNNFLRTADESQMRKIIMDIRDNVIPWLLGDKEIK